MSMTGSITFEGIRYLIPVANALYALQAIIVGDLVAVDILLTLGANIFCEARLIAAVRVFKREAVLYRSQTSFASDWRRPEGPQDMAASRVGEGSQALERRPGLRRIACSASPR